MEYSDCLNIIYVRYIHVLSSYPSSAPPTITLWSNLTHTINSGKSLSILKQEPYSTFHNLE